MPGTTFSYDNSLPTWLDYARWRLDDVDPANPFFYNETYLRIYNLFGPQEGLARIAASMFVIISQRVTSFGEAAGIRFSKDNLKYFKDLPDIIRTEPPYSPGVAYKIIRGGQLTAGTSHTCPCLPCGIPDTVRIWKCEILYPPQGV